MRKGRGSVPTDNIWSYAVDSGHTEGQDLTGCTVLASDGTVGHVDRQADHFGMRHLVVDTGVWVFGRSVLVPVGTVRGVDTAARTVTVACTRAEIKAAPRFRTDSETMDREYLAAVGDYYDRLPPRETTDD
ncbi:PRC-barrel domain containing protein [Streptomyces sp. HO565]|uniref:PRC-barrel domain containing protein n=1 Tax=Streptomyces sp. HO565 TaxID=2857489 RepID=UPI0034DC3992